MDDEIEALSHSADATAIYQWAWSRTTSSFDIFDWGFVFIDEYAIKESTKISLYERAE